MVYIEDETQVYPPEQHGVGQDIVKLKWQSQ